MTSTEITTLTTSQVTALSSDQMGGLTTDAMGDMATSQTYALEFGHQYMRVVNNGGHVLEAAVAVTAPSSRRVSSSVE